MNPENRSKQKIILTWYLYIALGAIMVMFLSILLVQDKNFAMDWHWHMGVITIIVTIAGALAIGGAIMVINDEYGCIMTLAQTQQLILESVDHTILVSCALDRIRRDADDLIVLFGKQNKLQTQQRVPANNNDEGAIELKVLNKEIETKKLALNIRREIVEVFVNNLHTGNEAYGLPSQYQALADMNMDAEMMNLKFDHPN